MVWYSRLPQNTQNTISVIYTYHQKSTLVKPAVPSITRASRGPVCIRCFVLEKLQLQTFSEENCFLAESAGKETVFLPDI